jgi:hypothetical protein
MKKNYQKLYLVITLVCFLGSTKTLFSQGNTPCTATSINSNTTCVNTGGTTASLTYQNDVANAGTPSCASPGTPDGWYSFTPTITTTFTISLTAGGITDSGMSIYTNSSGCSGTFTEVECDDDDGTGSMSQIIRTLTAGTTYYIRIWRYSSGTGTFSICVVQGAAPPPGPSNDDPTGATPITPAASCSYTFFTTAGASATSCGTIPAPGCASYSGGDVWFSVVVPASGGFILDSQTGVITDGGMAVYSGSPCGAMSLLNCDDDTSPNGAMPSVTVAATAGSTVYVRFWEYGNDNNGTFGICATTYTPPAAPSNNNPCGATPVTVNPSSTCTSQSGGSLVGATSSTVGLGSCFGNPDDDVWYSFVATSVTHTVSLNNVAGSATDLYHSIHPGPCGSIGAALVCSDPNSSTVTGLTIGATYFIRVYSYTSGSQTTTFSVCVTTPPPPPSNDNPTGATPITPAASCSYTTFTNVGATATTCGTIPAPGCASYSGGDVWFSVVVPASGGFILDSQTGGITDGGMAVYSGVACGAMSLLYCDDDSSPNGAMPSVTVAATAGSTVYVRFWEYSNDINGTFGICATTYTPPPAPSNNNPCGATIVTVNPALTCTSQSNGSVVGATSSTVGIGSCFGNPDDDVWYSFVATSTSHNIALNNVAGSSTDLYHSVHPGPCGSIGTALVCSDPNTSTVNGLTIGSTYFIRVYTYTSGSQTTTFSVCVTTPPPTGPCGNSANNDFCSNPATLTQGVGTFSSTTSGTYTDDEPGNLSSEFCGSIENNSWYSFVATAASASFPITSVSGCTSGWGVQAEVYSVTTTTNNCCTAFTSVSNCFNPGTNTTGTVTATGLTIGQTYLLMFDGNAGDVCSFTVSNWTAVGILPIELLNFVGHNEDKKNKIQWVTSSEKNSNYFRVEKSKDGINFEKLLDNNAAGNSQSPKYYNVFDLNPFEEITYYRLKLYNNDGSFEYSNIISINNSNLTDYISATRPNPTNGDIEFDINMIQKGNILIEIYNNNGGLIHSNQQILNPGYQSLNLDLNKYDSGIYLLKVSFENSGKTEIQKIIKN